MTEPICRVFGYLLPVVANARLISASPDTLESLIEVLPIAEGLLIQDRSESGEDMSPEDAAKFERAHKCHCQGQGRYGGFARTVAPLGRYVITGDTIWDRVIRLLAPCQSPTPVLHRMAASPDTLESLIEVSCPSQRRSADSELFREW